MRIRNVVAILLVLLSTIALAQPSTQSPTSIYYPAKPIKPGQTQPPMMTMPLVMPLFLEGNHFSSKLVLINDSSADTFADITIRGRSGQDIVERRIAFSPHSQQSVMIDDLLRSVHSSATSGSIVIMQSLALKGPAIAGALSMTYSGSGSASFIDEEPSMLNSMGSRVLQGVVDRADGSPTVAISSMEKTIQHIKAECLSENKIMGAAKHFDLRPNETILANPCTLDSEVESETDTDLFTGLGRSSLGPLGIVLSSDAMPGSFAAFAVAPHSSMGDRFLSSVLFSDPMELNSPNTVFSGVPVGPASLLPEGTFTPHLSLVNFSKRSIRAQIRYARTTNGVTTAHEIARLVLGPSSTREIEWNSLEGDTGLQNSFIVASDGPPGSVMAKLVSKSNTILHQLELQAKDMRDMNNAGNHPWSIEDSDEATLLLFNHSAISTPFDVTVSSDGVDWQRTYRLASMETRAVSIRDLIVDQVADEHGIRLPKSALRGELNWMVVELSRGSGRLLQSDRLAGMARNFSCGYSNLLCGTNFNIYESIMATGDIDTFAELVPITCTGGTQNACTGQRTGTGGSFNYSWGSGSPGIAAVNGSSILSSVNLKGVAPGTSRVAGQVQSQYCSAGGTNPQNVAPVIDSISPSVIPVGQNTSVSITGAGFGTSPIVNLPTGVTSSGQTSNGTTISLTLSVPTNTVIGNDYVTVTANGETSSPPYLVVLDGPYQMDVVADNTYPAGTGGGICPGSNVCRYVTYQITNYSGTSATSTNICEAPVLSAWSCSQSAPSPSFAACPSLSYTQSNGQFTDEWTLGSSSYTPAGCGYTITDTWKWGYPSPPSPLGLLSGFLDNNAIKINNVTSPNKMSPGTVIPR